MRRLGLITAISLWLAAGPVWADCGQSQELIDQAAGLTELAGKIELLEKAYRLCPGFKSGYRLGKAYALAGRNSDALGALHDAWNQAGDTVQGATALAKAGQIYQENGETQYAIASYKQALSIFKKRGKAVPKLVERLKDLEWTQTQQGMTAAQITKALCFKSFQVEPALDLRIHFDFDSYNLNQRGLTETRVLGQALADQVLDGNNFVLIGHTDRRGSNDYNFMLSQNRARAVGDFLVRNYPSLTGRIITEGKGETELIYQGDTEKEHQLNRRVEVRVTK